MQIKKTRNQGVAERRRFRRADRNIAIKLRDQEADFVTETKNISCIGAYCSIDTYLPILTKLKITLLLPKCRNSKKPKHITCEGTIVRVEHSGSPIENNKYNIAIYFNEISKGDMKLIDEYVRESAAQQA